MAILAFGFYSPLLSKQIKAIKATGINSMECQRLDQKQRGLGVILIIVALSIVFLMTVKPF
jgi:hypothetical protein